MAVLILENPHCGAGITEAEILAVQLNHVPGSITSLLHNFSRAAVCLAVKCSECIDIKCMEPQVASPTHMLAVCYAYT